ncbi:MAG TPA: hypothetical protein VN578_16705 [Candidatus Binatia bacterium]|jgi:hypothetical protein|nr:hypothetical protein [Candidatus Binatia bacterium]
MQNLIQLRNPSGETATLELLKLRLLLRRLDEIPRSELHAAVMREADTAASLARQTDFPLLAFPCLFEERADRVAEHERQQSHRYWLSLA